MSNSDYYDIVNVGSSRLATDGECIRDAFIKINNNNTTIFNTVLDYDINAQFDGWKLIVGVDNEIVVTNQISISNSVDVSVMQITEVSNDININVENSLDIDIANNIDISINSGNISIISDINNDIVLTANSFTFSNVIYAPSITSNVNTNNITFNANDIDINNTFGDININSVTNDINITGDLVVNTNMFDINVTTGDINIQNGAITINNALDVDINNAITVDVDQEVNINNALTIDNSNNIDIGINNSISIDASQNITFAPNTNIDFTNINTMNLDINLVNQVDVDFNTITNNQILIYNSTSENFEAGVLSINDLSDVNSDMNPGGGDTLIWDAGNSRWTAGTVSHPTFAWYQVWGFPTESEALESDGAILRIDGSNATFDFEHHTKMSVNSTGALTAEDTWGYSNGSVTQGIWDVTWTSASSITFSIRNNSEWVDRFNSVKVGDTIQLWYSGSWNEVTVTGPITKTYRDIESNDYEVPINLDNFDVGISRFKLVRSFDTLRDGIISSNLYSDDSSILYDAGTGEFHGTLRGDVIGSLYSDDSTQILDGVSGEFLGNVAYTPDNDAFWNDPKPTTVAEALNRMAENLYVTNGFNPF